MVVESTELAVAEPPPDTVTELTCGDVAVAPTLTVTVIGGYVEPGVRASLRVHDKPPREQVQPVPPIDTSVSPDGTVSVTIIVPFVGPPVAPLLTVSVYVAAVCP